MDQFYTKDEIAKECYNTLLEKIDKDDYTFLEPSAGKGSFFKLLPENRREGIDLEPKYEGIKTQDYFTYRPTEGKKYVVIGNPPFGKISSLAIKFFNHSKFAHYIAFIIPRTFKRVSVQNKLNPYFHLIHTQDLPMKPCCFEPKMEAKCCFQIWEKRKEKRNLVVYESTHPDFKFVKHGPRDDNNQPTPPVRGVDLALRAYGSNCGEIVDENFHLLRPKSWHFIKSEIPLDILKERLTSLDYTISKDTVRQDSLGRKDLIFLYSQKF